MEDPIMATATKTVRIGAGEGLELPEKIRRAAGLADGDTVYINIEDEGDAGLHVRIRKIDPDQAWFWTPKWQAGEREADEDKAAGRFTTYYSDEEFLSALKQWSDDGGVLR